MLHGILSFLGWTIVFLLGLLLLFLAGVFWVYFILARDMVRATRKFFALIKLGKTTDAYQFMLSPGFQAELSEAKFLEFLHLTELIDAQRTVWPERGFGVKSGSLKGHVVTRSGRKVPLEISLVKEDGDWYITSLSSEIRVSIPPLDQALNLAKSSFLTFWQALQTEDFTEFHATLASSWQQQSTPEALQVEFQEVSRATRDFLPEGLQQVRSQTFEEFFESVLSNLTPEQQQTCDRDAWRADYAKLQALAEDYDLTQIDFASLMVGEFTLTEPPVLDGQYRLQLQGQVLGLGVIYHFDYIWEEGTWQLIGLRITNHSVFVKPDQTESAAALCDRDNQKYQNEDLSGAIADFNKAIEINPNDADAYNNRGLTRADLGDKQGAIADFNKAIEINPNLANAYCNRGRTRGDLGDNQGAIADFNKAIEINPNYANAYCIRAATRSALGDKQGAIEDYTQAIEINPNDVYAYCWRGLARADLGDKQGAIEDYSRAIKIKPNDANTYCSRGVIRADLGDKQGAIADYNQALEINPNSENAYFNRGLARADLGDKQGAIADFNKAIEIEPSYRHICDIGGYR